MESTCKHEKGAASVGLAGSASIPVATAAEVDATYCLRFMRHVRDCAFATMDAEGLPSVRIIDVMHVKGERLYFLVPRGKAFHSELETNPVVAIVAQTTDFRMCRLRGRAVRPQDPSEQRRLVDMLFDLNPGMNALYPGESRYVCDAFCIEDGDGEYYDLGQKPLLRVPFRIGRGLGRPTGAYAIDARACTGCASCARVCPQDCIESSGNGTRRIVESACLRCGLCAETCPAGAIGRR